jgi:hypothetical protein
MLAEPLIAQVCPVQTPPLKFLGLLQWLDKRPLLQVMELYRQQILTDALHAFRPDGSPLYRRVLTGRGKKNSKTLDAVLASLYKLLAWKASGAKGNQIYFVASDLGQANDDLDLCKKLIRCNPVLDNEVTIKSNVIERKDGRGFIEILPAGDVSGLHGKTYLFLVVDECTPRKIIASWKRWKLTGADLMPCSGSRPTRRSIATRVCPWSICSNSTRPSSIRASM